MNDHTTWVYKEADIHDAFVAMQRFINDCAHPTGYVSVSEIQGDAHDIMDKYALELPK